VVEPKAPEGPSVVIEAQQGPILGPWIETSDEANCEDVTGNEVGAFATNQRCYRVTISAIF
jgi:hypothetical protein